MTETRYVQWAVREDVAPWTLHKCYTVSELEAVVARLEADGTKFTIFAHGVRP